MKIGIYSGSFNPIHHGHLMIANYMAEFAELDEVWFVLSPHNPLKDRDILALETHRTQMLELALRGFSRLKACDIELHLPRPSYTIDTLGALQKQYPQHSFSLIIGSDNWAVFGQWKDYESLIQQHKVLIYERLNYPIHIPPRFRGQVETADAPIIELSSTFLRYAIANGKDVRAFLPPPVWEYIQQHQLYKGSL